MQFPIGGLREPVYDYMRRLGFVESNWSDKIWTRADGLGACIFGAGSMVQLGKDEMPLGELRSYLSSKHHDGQ